MTAMLAGSAAGLQALIDSVVDYAPICLRERTLLQAVDWSKVSAEKVAFMLGRLETDSVRAPNWLVKSLLLAGHVLPASPQITLDTPLHALNGLNRMVRDKAETAGPEGLDGLIDDLAARTELDPDILTTSVRRLIALGEGQLAARLALAHWSDVPQALRLVQDELDRLVGDFPKVRLRVTGFSTTHGLASELPIAFAAAGLQSERRRSGLQSDPVRADAAGGGNWS